MNPATFTPEFELNSPSRPGRAVQHDRFDQAPMGVWNTFY